MYAARKLRNAMSLPEVLLWQRLRGGKNGVKVRRQHPIGSYVIDFYAPAARLAIEIDGAIHDARQDHDFSRDAFLRENGHHIVHIPAAEVLRDPDAVAAAIVALAASPLHHSPAASGPPPRAGEDR